MKFLIRDARGIAHHFLLALIVVGVAIGGTYYLVASYADTCDTSSPVTEAASAATEPSCTTVSEAATEPISVILTCTITGVPSNPTYGSVLDPTVTLTNVTNSRLDHPTINASTGTGNNQGQGKGAALDIKVPAIIEAGATYTTSFSKLSPDFGGGWKVNEYASTTGGSTVGGYQVDSYRADGQAHLCAKADFKLPKAPAATYAATCSVMSTNFTTTGAKGFYNVTITNKGTTAITPQITYSYKMGASTVSKVWTSTLSRSQGIAPGGLRQIATGSFVPTKAGDYTFNFSGTAGTAKFNCSKAFTVKAPLTYKTSCVINGIPNTVKKGSAFKPSVTVKSTGTGTVTAVNALLAINPDRGDTISFVNFPINGLASGKSATKDYTSKSFAKSSKATTATARVKVQVNGTGASTGSSTCTKVFAIKN